MPGRHRGPDVLGPRFIHQAVRHANRYQIGSRTSELGSTLLLLPEDDDNATRPREPGRHRRTDRQHA